MTWRGEEIPLLTLGTAQLGIPGYGVANRNDAVEQLEVEGIVAAAWNVGIRIFDTAQCYGDAEERLGNVFSRTGLPSPRVITKLSPELEPDDCAAIKESLAFSRSRLGLSCLWGVMLHRFSWLEKWGEGLGGTLLREKEDGNVKHLGVSVYEADEAIESIHHPDIDIIQIPINVWDRRMIRAGVLEAAKKYGKLLFLRSIFLQGLLLLSPEEAEQRVRGVGKASENWHAVAANLGIGPRELALSWAAGLGWPMVIGVEAEQQVAEIAQGVSNQRLEEKQRIHLEQRLGDIDDEHILDPRSW